MSLSKAIFFWSVIIINVISAAKNDKIKEIDAPLSKIINYDFCVFGDTRTSKDSSLDGQDVSFSLARTEVFKGVSNDLEKENSKFALFTGDMIWKGGEKKYWIEPKEIFGKNNVLKKIYPIPGNHETWEDTTLLNYFSTFKQLKENHSYYYIIGKSLFISLCTGGYIGDYTDSSAFAQDRIFTCTEATFDDLNLLKFLKDASKDMKDLDNIFIQYHKPSYSFYKHPPLNKENDPVEVLKDFIGSESDLQVYVFNGHNHTTELYQPTENITVLVAGGGGAPQKILTPKDAYSNYPDSLKLPSEAVKKIYEDKATKEVFWKMIGSDTWSRTKRINYWIVSVDDKSSNVIVTEKVLTYNSENGMVFVDGLVLKNGKQYLE